MTAAPLRLSAPEHVILLHPRREKGSATVSSRDENGEWCEESVKLPRLADYVANLEGRCDIFVSQQSFFGRRSIINLAQLSVVYVDIDYHKITRLKGETPCEAVNEVIWALEDAGMPLPSMIISTGRGLLAVWLHEPVQRRAHLRWQRVQRELWSVLEPLGGDRGALDAARVFRLVGSINSKVGRPVRVIWGDVENPMRWSFGDLADAVLPYTLDEIHRKRDERRAKVRSLGVERARRGNCSAPRRRNEATLWEKRLSDLRKLLYYRYPGGALPPGNRDEWLFIAAVAISWFCPSEEVLIREIEVLAEEVGGWDNRETGQRMCAVIARKIRAGNGEMIDHAGKPVDPRYRFRTETIIERLGISEGEMRGAGLQVLISDSIKRERDRERKAQDRRAKGQRERAEYEAGSAERMRPWEQLGMSRATWYRKGKPMWGE